jgi:hypothetical protein
MNRLVTSLVVPAALVAAVSIPASAAAPSMTPDQRLVAGLEQARSAARETLGGKPALQKVIAGVRSARMAAPRAIGALELPTVRAVLRQGEPLARRRNLRRLIPLTSAALDDFGLPLEKDFASFAVGRV